MPCEEQIDAVADREDARTRFAVEVRAARPDSPVRSAGAVTCAGDALLGMRCSCQCLRCFCRGYLARLRSTSITVMVLLRLGGLGLRRMVSSTQNVAACCTPASAAYYLDFRVRSGNRDAEPFFVFLTDLGCSSFGGVVVVSPFDAAVCAAVTLDLSAGTETASDFVSADVPFAAWLDVLWLGSLVPAGCGRTSSHMRTESVMAPSTTDAPKTYRRCRVALLVTDGRALTLPLLKASSRSTTCCMLGRGSASFASIWVANCEISTGKELGSGFGSLVMCCLISAMVVSASRGGFPERSS